MKYPIAELLDIPKLQTILDSLYEVSGIPSAIIDLEGKILTGSGWQDICTRFHRGNPATEKFCIESDQKITSGLQDQQRHVQITCPMGLTDTATPLIIEGEHLANIFTGQLFLQPPDRGRFQLQAQQYGFEEASYLLAMDRVPVISQDKLDQNLSFIANLTELLALQGLTQLRSLEVQECLRESEERVQQIITSAQEGIIVYDCGLRFQVWNRYMEQLSGHSAGDVIGKLPQEVFPMLEHSGVVERLRRVLAGDGVTSDEVELRLPGSGRTIWHSDTLAPLKNASGEIVGVIATVRDITERKQTEEQLRQALKMESVGRLAGGVAHDFNNMLTVIMGQAQLAQMKIAPGHPLWQPLEQIGTAAQRSSQITRQLLAFSRKEIIEPRPVDLNQLITEAQKTLLRLIEENITLHCLPGADLWPVKMDPSQVDQVLVNLAVNARDAMPNGGVLSIHTDNVHLSQKSCQYLHDAVPGDYVQLVVSDTGVGMEAEVLEHLFEPFYTTKGVGKGTGLGLATVYGIVRQNGGFINVYSEVGHGTSFKIFLPRTSGDAPAGTQRRCADVRIGSGTVLLVEDNDMVRRVTRSYLEELGYHVIVADTPRGGIDICNDRQNKIDLVLTDVIMPGMSGNEMVHEIKAHFPEVKVLFMSGYTADLVARSGVVEEGMHFIQKPFDISTLSVKIEDTFLCDD
ncbi:PocR ligand-binding domain-containing protein [Geomonas subterranea]|uniref:histidine kinase n=1 Tax=Geomonas subterranea TaxID=2847989 RepID=A0ABX8LG33_9BACT|nr:PocR ligand-binding domain-containing protein [Geomonas subterranea]QXE89652.1 PocR ligand-binding domain-containing protein [Geomonas subterranea]QXM08233.1 PocR ligand-binding domain-containing protein [Geomonas subterranea]